MLDAIRLVAAACLVIHAGCATDVRTFGGGQGGSASSSTSSAATSSAMASSSTGNANGGGGAATTGNGAGAPGGAGGMMTTGSGCTPDPQTTTCTGKCGLVTNNCGQQVDCGNPCKAPDTCGGGGTPSVCGCTDDGMTCVNNGQVCGLAINSCGQQINCGPCAAKCCFDSCVCMTCLCP